MSEKIDFAIGLIKKAQKEILKKKDKFTFEQKTNHSDLVTDVDVYIEEFISQKLVSKYFNDSVLGEERSKYYNEEARNQWILDPIDGTLNFITQGKNFAISLAYYEKKKPIFGIVLDVINDDLYYA